MSGTILALYPHGFTGHSHPCCKMAPRERPPGYGSASRCGGPARCQVCAGDVEQLHASAHDPQLVDVQELSAELSRLRPEVDRARWDAVQAAEQSVDLARQLAESTLRWDQLVRDLEGLAEGCCSDPLGESAAAAFRKAAALARELGSGS